MTLNYLSSSKFVIPDELREKAYKQLENNINDTDIQNFLREHDLANDQEFIRRNATTIMSYIHYRDNDPFFYPIIKLYCNNMDLTLSHRSNSQKIRLSNGETYFAQVYYDSITKNFKDIDVDLNMMTIYDIAVMEKMKEFRDNYKYGSLNKGIWLYGNYGVGKNILNELLFKRIGKARNRG